MAPCREGLGARGGRRGERAGGETGEVARRTGWGSGLKRARRVGGKGLGLLAFLGRSRWRRKVGATWLFSRAGWGKEGLRGGSGGSVLLEGKWVRNKCIGWLSAGSSVFF